MKYYLVTWTAEDKNLDNFSGNATLEWEGEYPSDEDIIENIKLSDPKLKDFKITLQDKLEFDSQADLDRYGKS